VPKKYCFFLLCLLIIGLVVLDARGPALAQPLAIDLDKVVELALGSDRSIKAAESDVAKANEERRQAHRSRSVTMTIDHSTARTEYQIQDIGANSFQNTVSATYPLYTGGLIEGTIAASEHELRSKILSLERARQNVILSVKGAFFDMLRAKDMAKLAGDSVERLKAHVRNVDVLYRNGSVGRADLLRSEVELINAAQTMSQAENEYRVSIKTLNDAIGLPLGTELSYEGDMSYAALPYTLDECIEYALSRRPDLEAAELLQKKAQAGVTVEESGRRPRVTLSASQTFSSPYNWPGLDQDNLQIAVQAEYTFSDAGVTESKIRGAREDVKRMGYNYESVRDAIVLDVTRYFMTTQETIVRIETASQAVDMARDAYRIALVRYREGVGTNIDVLDAEAALNQTYSNHTQALCDYNIAAAQLENAVGDSMPFR